MMRRLAVCALVVLAAAVFGCGRPANPAAEKAAVASAEAWLALIDDGKYAESWEASAALFRAAVPEEQWTTQLGAVRKPLGKTLSRDVKAKRYQTTMPGAPDGEYVVIQFGASFENKKSAVETVTPMREEDGAWRVSGYFIK